jgi:plastocyanin
LARVARKRAAVVLALAGCSALYAAPASHAEGQISAGPPNMYLTPAVTIDQGEPVTFVNADAVEHDVLARDAGPDGKPLFRSELIGFAQAAPVEGTEYLVTGDYTFICSIHPQMEGTLTVSSAGKPVPRPGAKTSLKLRVRDSKIAKVKRRGALRVRVTTNRAADVRMTARTGGKAFAKGTAKLAGAGAKTVKLKLTRAGRKLVRRKKRIPLTVSASAKNGDGNASQAKAKAKATLR